MQISKCPCCGLNKDTFSVFSISFAKEESWPYAAIGAGLLLIYCSLIRLSLNEAFLFAAFTALSCLLQFTKKSVCINCGADQNFSKSH
ncbi:MAG: hypothetical protein KDD56_08900 [Bdellovibrionales bacterium]|nr:hypothetical protein [Bdellovibrionales bacterium]